MVVEDSLWSNCSELGRTCILGTGHRDHERTVSIAGSHSGYDKISATYWVYSSASCYGWGTMSGYWSKFWFLKGGWVTLSANFRVNGGSSTNEFWRQKTRAPGLSCGVVLVILCLAVLIQYRPVTHRQTDTGGDTASINIILPLVAVVIACACMRLLCGV